MYRQSLSLLALKAAGATPDPSAVQWLKNQQCADGSFTNYRANTAVACVAKEKDSNATGLAIQALAALGQPTATAVQALRGFQLDDGGFYVNQIYGPPASDANSTGIALSAFTAVGIDPATVQRAGKNGQGFLLTMQLACDEADATQRGAYDYLPETPLAANDFATVQAALGMAGKALPVAPATGTNDAPAYVCPSAGTLTATDSANAAAGYLARRIAGGSGLIPSSYGTGADYTSTANAVLALVATGKGADQVSAAMAALAANVAADKITDKNGKDVPGALAVLTLTAHATGANPASFGGADLVARLAATLTKAPLPSPRPRSRRRSRSSPSPVHRWGCSHSSESALSSSVGPSWPGRCVEARADDCPARREPGARCGLHHRRGRHGRTDRAGRAGGVCDRLSLLDVLVRLRVELELGRTGPPNALQDGAVVGWRFSISPDSQSSTPPRAASDFGAICGGTPVPTARFGSRWWSTTVSPPTLQRGDATTEQPRVVLRGAERTAGPAQRVLRDPVERARHPRELLGTGLRHRRLSEDRVR